ncbi:MAG: hypothetical protein CME98_22250 [Hyphomonas sp.]|nr:hypothetical protein [Hyphomonas sp.]
MLMEKVKLQQRQDRPIFCQMDLNFVVIIRLQMQVQAMCILHLLNIPSLEVKHLKDLVQLLRDRLVYMEQIFNNRNITK